MITKEQAYKKIQELVTRFEEQYSSYKKSEYNETLTRRDFIDPFFKALGWDIDNEQGYAEAYREVIHEDKIKVGKATKAPDYSFRIGGGKRLFFVEAKKPSVDVKGEIAPAYQVRRYGWSAKLPISIITDFEEFAVYDCTKKPNPSDKASVSRTNYLTFRDYLTQFDFLWDTFSKEKVLKGSFDKYVQSTANKKGTATVDKEFLLSLDTWRTLLAENIAKSNKELETGFSNQFEWRETNFTENEVGGLHLYKLHGSIDWFIDDKTQKLKKSNREGIDKSFLIFGTDDKVQAIDPYLFYLHEFRKWTLESNIIFVLGYSYSDGHINSLLIQTLNQKKERIIFNVDVIEEEEQKKYIQQTLKLKDQKQIKCINSSAKHFLNKTLTVEFIEQLMPNTMETNPF